MSLGNARLLMYVVVTCEGHVACSLFYVHTLLEISIETRNTVAFN